MHLEISSSGIQIGTHIVELIGEILYPGLQESNLYLVAPVVQLDETIVHFEQLPVAGQPLIV